MLSILFMAILKEPLRFKSLSFLFSFDCCPVVFVFIIKFFTNFIPVVFDIIFAIISDWLYHLFNFLNNPIGGKIKT
jgi:hypothetical protein